MDPVTGTRLRRQLPMFAAVVVGALFVLVHSVVFGPLAARYSSALATARSLGLSVDPAHPFATSPLPPRVYALLMDNSLPVSEADARAQSGSLAAEVVQLISGIAARHGLEVVVAEPGTLTTQANSVELRAHLKLRGRYSDFVAMLDELAAGGRLWYVERFSMDSLDPHREDMELWISSCILKRTRGAT
jgi:hypothetical protein